MPIRTPTTQRIARGRGVGITLSTYNTLLKAYVLACAPFATVFGFFTRLKELGMRPDKYTYALVVQSACDAGDMDAAKELAGRGDYLPSPSSGAIGVAPENQ